MSVPQSLFYGVTSNVKLSNVHTTGYVPTLPKYVYVPRGAVAGMLCVRCALAVWPGNSITVIGPYNSLLVGYLLPSGRFTYVQY